MKYLKSLSIAALFTIALFTSCERDDICPASTPTTPRLIIEAYDAAVQENSKNIFGLVVLGVDNDEVLDGYSVVSTDELILPLRTDTTTTQYSLISGYSYDDNDTPDDTSDDIIEGNEDIITISYTTEQVYVSRACGYKTIFNNVSFTIEDDGDNWILSRSALIDNQTIEDETAAHYNIFH
ncbi:hypothetical protein APS56_00315 [Pseudalgibacter alginicilyticus]|uniref:Lipoprotein n=1 Tax=Pseudalgibacter alginicilyticus TaxID=1736674 RepID=A0A0P0CCW9_9FLAO|nr:DUF6452 family protein [Pseudalgibacter alginicilyticus]ALJ03684.1 hypothetical protein APS56_00315 [Pseudalgibacter alginicilyticus]